jgi:branched-chain amino acid transport system permease protein
VNALDMYWLSWTGVVDDKINVFDYTTRYYVIFALCLLFVLVSIRLRDGKLGRAWLAIREDELAASLMGVPLMRTKLWAYGVGAAAGGIGGAFYCVSLGGVNVDTFNFQFSVIVLCMVILGGMANVYGCILGAVILTWVNYTGMKEIGNAINNTFGTTIEMPHYQFLIFGFVLVLMMLFRRDGILPAARQKQSRALDAQLEKIGTEEAPA